MIRNGKEYELLSIDTIARMLDENGIRFDRMVVRDKFAMNLDMIGSLAGDSLLNRLRTPFHVNDIRIMRLVKGSVKIEINFHEYELKAGDIMMVKEDSYIELHDISEDTGGQAIAYSPERYPSNLQLNGKNTVKVTPTEKEWEEISRLLYMIYSTARHEPYRKDAVEPMVTSLVNNILYMSHPERSHPAYTAAEHLYHRFMDELNRNVSGKMPAKHYAEKLCVTPQYLSRIVSQVSGKTVSHWINKATIMKARILLRDTSKTISEISEVLGFPNDSFFCSFFKRETGQTPTSYRKL